MMDTLKAFGLAGFLFFLIKGLMWLVLFALVARGVVSKDKVDLFRRACGGGADPKTGQGSNPMRIQLRFRRGTTRMLPPSGNVMAVAPPSKWANTSSPLNVGRTSRMHCTSSQVTSGKPSASSTR